MILKKLFKKVRYTGACAIALLLITLGFTRKMKNKALNGDFILSIYFHSPAKKLFEFCITWLKKNNFHFLSQKDILLIANKSLPFPKGGVIITVDDGWQSNEENVAAIAEKHKVPVTIFISSEPVETGNFWWSYIKLARQNSLTRKSIESLKKMPDEARKSILQPIKQQLRLNREALTVHQVKTLSKSAYINFGSHTVTHPVLINCGNEEAYAELKISKEKIESWTGRVIDCFAYPNGDYGEREIKYLKETGYNLSYTTKPDYLTEGRMQKIYELPRFCVFENISEAEAICRMLGVWQFYFN